MNMKVSGVVTTFLLFVCMVDNVLSSCRRDDFIVPSTSTEVGSGGSADGPIKGFFLLNEGNMGSNKASLDYYDYETGVYMRNIYAERNPDVVKELGDVGNDLQIYGNRLYAVINCSNMVEVMDVETARHIGQVSIPNCRYIAFKDGYAYVSSYAGPVEMNPNARRGYVAKVDTLTLQVTDTCVVGYQPEEMAVVGNKLYVANSGGYMAPDYDRTVSVIDLNTFSVSGTIDVAINLHRMETDSRGYLYVSSRGDYRGISSMTFVIDTETDEVVEKLNMLPNSNMTMVGDSLYIYCSEWSYNTNTSVNTYALYNTLAHKTVTRNFIKDGTEKNIKVPYGLAVNRSTGEIFVTDAGDYVTPGILYCFGADGKMKWKVRTGDIPAHIAFTTKKLQ